MSAIVERRREGRHERGDLDMALFLDGREISSCDYSLLDISRHGLGLHVQRRVRVGQTLEFRLSLPGGTVRGRGAVRWVSESGGGSRCGVSMRTSGVLDGMRLDRFLDPSRLDIPLLLDRLLFAAAVGVAFLCAAEFFGLL